MVEVVEYIRHLQDAFDLDILMPSVVTAVLSMAVIAVIILSIHHRRRKHSFFGDHDIPFVHPHIIYGSLHELKNKSGGENEMDVMERWIKTYGNVFGYFVGTTPYLVVADLDIAKEILIKRSSNYINRPKLAIKAEPVVDTLVGLRDGRWKEVRSMLSHAFTAAKVKLVVGVMNEKLDTLVSLIERDNSRSKQLEWLTTYQGLTLEVISKCAFAMETKCMEKQNEDPFFEAVRDFLRKAVNSAVLWAQYFPIIAAMMTFINNYWSKSGKATQMVVANLQKAILARRENVSERKTDILQIILDNSEDYSSSANKHYKSVEPLSNREIIANSWVFLLGGYETTASALTFTTYLLALHPEIQEKLYQEMRMYFPLATDEHIHYEDVMKLSYLDQVINESLRLYPPVSTFLTREATEQDNINGTKIPKETNIVVPIWHIHRNSKYWPDPQKFDPERFSSEAKADPGRHPMSFIPFGAGPRNCIGMRFGQTVTKLTLTRLLLKYRFEPCEATPDPLQLRIDTVTLLPEEEILLRIVKRRQ